MEKHDKIWQSMTMYEKIQFKKVMSEIRLIDIIRDRKKFGEVK